MHRARFVGSVPEVQFGMMIERAPGPAPGDSPQYRGFPFALMGPLIGARLAVLLNRK